MGPSDPLLGRLKLDEQIHRRRHEHQSPEVAASEPVADASPKAADPSACGAVAASAALDVDRGGGEDAVAVAAVPGEVAEVASAAASHGAAVGIDDAAADVENSTAGNAAVLDAAVSRGPDAVAEPVAAAAVGAAGFEPWKRSHRL